MPAGADDALSIEGAPNPLTPTHLTLLPWPDAVIDRVGHDPRSEYVERFWLGVIGPSCTWFMRRLAVGFDAEPEGFELDVAECARALGLGAGLGRNAPLGRTVTRCCQFGLTRRFGRNRLAVRRRLPPLARHHLARLPDALQAEHGRWAGPVGGTPGAPGGPVPAPAPTPAPAARTVDADRRAMADDAGRLALRLLRAGQDPESARRSLQGWGAPAALAGAAVEWAARRLQASAAPAA